MSKISTANQVMAGISVVVLLLSFILLYQDTQEFFSSLTAAVLSAALVWVALIMLYWLSKVFTK